MNQRTTGIALFSLLAGLSPLATQAASPGLSITATGAPTKWDNTKSITYNIDQGPLSAKYTNSKAARIVAAAFDQWQKIDTAKLTFEESDGLDQDVTGANIGAFIQGVPSDVNPIIFDQDGGVTDAFLGTGAARGTLAFGGILQATPTGKIAQGFVVMNGRMLDGQFDPDDVSEAEMTRAAVRAIGQMLNVGDSDLNDELIFDGNIANNSAVPIMHPASVIGGGFVPTLDDRMEVSTLYPSTSFDANTGIIRGQVVLADGTTGLQGIDVIARKVDDPINTAVSTITGNGFQNANRGGSRDPSLRGAYEMHVPPGNYTIEYRPLKQPIGPGQEIFPLPGGAQFYAGAPTAGPVDPAQAVPVTVTAGQATEVKLVAGGTAAPAPQNVAEAEPNDAPIDAPLLPANAIVTGNITQKDPAFVVIDTGAGTRAGVQDMYRVVATQRSILEIVLQQKDKVDLDLLVFGGIPGGANSAGAGSLTDSKDVGEALQLVVNPGTYYVGVSAWSGADNTGTTDYTLSTILTPYTVDAAPKRPIHNQLVIGDVAADSAEVRWITDVDATADVVVSTALNAPDAANKSVPAVARQQFGDPAPAKAHKIALTGLTPESYTKLTAVSQLPGAGLDSIPNVFFHTASKTPATGPAKLQAVMIGQFQDFIQNGDPLQDERTLLAALAIRNTGGNAANAQITGLTVTPGWKLAVPVTAPIQVGAIGSGATAVVVVRLLRDGPVSTTTPDPVATVTGTGTATGADGAAANFSIGP